MLQPYFRINEVSGVSVVIGADGNLSISLCHVKANGNQLDILKKLTGISSFADLQKALPAKVPVALNIAGKGVLVKQTELLEEINAQYFTKVLPNANPDDFYTQLFNSHNQSFVALMRRTDTEKWLGQFEAGGIEVLNLSLGPFAVSRVLPHLNFYGEDIYFDGHQITLTNDGGWINYKSAPGFVSTFPVKLETQQIPEPLILAYAAAFQLIVALTQTPVQALAPQLQGRLRSVLANRKITVLSSVTLGVLFLLLLVNFLLFMHYTESNERLSMQVGQSTRDVSQLADLNGKIKAKEALLDSLGWHEGISQSVMIDRAAQLLPPELTWEEVAVDPVDKAAQRQLRFVNRTIRFTGMSDKIVAVNEWIGRLKTLKFVKDAKLQSYNYDSERNTGQFTVIVEY